MPFPYADRNAAYHRPAVVVGTNLGLDGMLIWVAMTTAAENRRWPGDIIIADHEGSGLPIPSVVRTSKIATVVARRAQKKGRLPDAEMEAVAADLAAGLQVAGRGGFNE